MISLAKLPKSNQFCLACCVPNHIWVNLNAQWLMHNAKSSRIVKWKWFSRICKCGDLPCLPVSMIRFSNIIMLIHQYGKNQPIYRYRDSSCWFTNIGQLGHLPISENRISDIRNYYLYFTEMDKQSCAHITVISPWTQFLAIQLKTFGENILKLRDATCKLRHQANSII